MSLTLERLIESYKEAASKYPAETTEEKQKGVSFERDDEIRKRKRLETVIKELETHAAKITNAKDDVRELCNIQINGPRPRY